MLVKDYAPKAQRLAQINRRLALIPGLIAELRPKVGRPPKVWTTMAIDDGEGASDFLGSELGEADAALVATAKGAYEQYLKFLKEELLARSDGSFGLGRPSCEFHLLTVN